SCVSVTVLSPTEIYPLSLHDALPIYTQFAKESEFEVWKLPDGSPAIEVPFEIQLGGVTVVGYIDVVWQWPDGSIEPVDYKTGTRSEEHTSELQSRENLVCRLLLEKKK